MSDQRNLFIAIGLSVAILIGFQYISRPSPEELAKYAEETAKLEQAAKQAEVDANGGAAPATPAESEKAAEPEAPSPRLAIKTPNLMGSIALRGGRLDQITLLNYRETVDPSSPAVTLLETADQPNKGYYVTFGWQQPEGAAQQILLPGPNALWQANGDELAPGNKVTLSWSNGQGLTFEREIEVDEHFLFTVNQKVKNTTGQPVELFPYAVITREAKPKTEDFYILHEGPLGVLDGKLEERSYADLIEDGETRISSQGGWLGITDKYWLTALIPAQDQAMRGHFRHVANGAADRFQVYYQQNAVSIPANGEVTAKGHLFVGAKVVEQLKRYEEDLGLPMFDRAVDFGTLYFLTIPIFDLLHFFAKWIGNFGLAILALTVVVKLLFFPLANKSYHAMAEMKALQPEMERLRERFKDDRERLSQSMMELYKERKVNPLAGCLPIIIQIPVFFALYKVLFVTIEMRHAPFYGWIHDLSAPDPTSLFNLFGLIPFDPPSFLMIGVWPILMGITMYLQQKLNPAPADPMQARIMSFLPLVFTIMLAPFAAGLVIYWTWNNILSMAQQYLIMKRHKFKENKPAKEVKKA